MMHHAMRIQQAYGIPATGVFLRSATQRADPIDLDLVRDLAHLLYRIADELKRTRDASAFNAFASSWSDFIEAGRAGVPVAELSVPLDLGELE